MPYPRLNRQAVRLILVLLNFSDYFCNFSSLAKVYQLWTIQQIILVALLDVENIGQVHA